MVSPDGEEGGTVNRKDGTVKKERGTEKVKDGTVKVSQRKGRTDRKVKDRTVYTKGGTVKVWQ